MKFVDRKEEKERLERSLNSGTPSFVAVYGRRRLGKSTLIKKVLHSSDIYFLADKSESQHQRQLLTEVISEKFPEFDSVEYPGWETLLRQLNLRTSNKLRPHPIKIFNAGPQECLRFGAAVSGAYRDM